MKMQCLNYTKEYKADNLTMLEYPAVVKLAQKDVTCEVHLTFSNHELAHTQQGLEMQGMSTL